MCGRLGLGCSFTAVYPPPKGSAAHVGRSLSRAPVEPVIWRYLLSAGG
ncbi:hypothetical protein E2C01_078423 [Portunus trituberculatus]|uniref:Uncharacterized protein n=1 Tax=Portunus trituberculatus TaxID=210409 RepID=A0A5B7ISQ2_PORTR|nr:hypothetical protein [Portunus trituberculatus]